MELISQFEAQLSIVPRWSIVHTIQRQSVAEHSFRVALMAPRVFARIYNIEPNDMTVGVLTRAALLHDQWEAFSGDIPSPAKKPMLYDKHHFEDYYTPFVKEKPEKLAEALTVSLKLADLIEGMIFMKQEMALGNKTVLWIYDDLGARVFETLQSINKIMWWDKLLSWLSTIDQQDPLDQRSPRVKS